MRQQIPIIALAILSTVAIIAGVVIVLFADLDAAPAIALVSSLTSIAVGGVGAIAGLVRGTPE